MFIRINSRKLRENWGAYLDHVMATGDRVMITRHGREQVALIPAGDLHRLEEVEDDLPPEAPSFITRVCGSGFHSLRFRFGQARRARSPQIAQASGALLRVFDFRAMSAV